MLPGRLPRSESGRRALAPKAGDPSGPTPAPRSQRVSGSSCPLGASKGRDGRPVPLGRHDDAATPTNGPLGTGTRASRGQRPGPLVMSRPPPDVQPSGSVWGTKCKGRGSLGSAMPCPSRCHFPTTGPRAQSPTQTGVSGCRGEQDCAQRPVQGQKSAQ